MSMFDGFITAISALKRPTVYDNKPRGLAAAQRYAVIGLAVLLLLAITAISFAQEIKPSTSPAASSSSTANNVNNVKPAKTSITKPLWAELTPMQKQSLKPLSQSWDNGISEAQKRKWLEISKNYPQLSSDDQLKLDSRMNEWVALSPQQRTEARLNFAKTQEISKQLSPEEKNAQWQTYQALSAEEKKKLADKAATERHIGAAPAVRPVAPQKLAALPPRPSSSSSNSSNTAEQAATPSKAAADIRPTTEVLPSSTTAPKN